MKIETLEKEISALENRRAELITQRDDRTQRANALEGQRSESVAQMLAEGGQSPRESEKAIGEIMRLRQTAQDYAAAIEGVDAKLDGKRLELARAQRQLALEALNAQITDLTRSDGAVKKALAELKAVVDKLFADTQTVCAVLSSFDQTRFGSRFLNTLETEIRQELLRCVGQFGFLKPINIEPFGSTVVTRFRAAAAQLEYEALQGRVVPAAGEKLYRVRSSIFGLRRLSLKPGDLIALTRAEAEDFKNNELELLEAETAA